MARDGISSNTSNELSGNAQLAEPASEDLASGSVLDYLWMDPPEGSAEPEAEEPQSPAGAAAKIEEPPEEASLQSSLKRYSDWLDSIGTD